ncbi:MAG: GtrA family protein [Burkholderiaceae bacterium]|nr:GtrA family protein [Burkholderiaceae bacterium]
MSISRQFIRFAAVGACGTAVQYIVLQIGTETLGIPAAVASGVGYMCGSVVNYLLNYFFTFESGKSHMEAATKYFSLLGIGFCINTGLMAVFVHQLGWNKWIAQFLTTGIGLIYNFLGSRFWAFKEAHR